MVFFFRLLIKKLFAIGEKFFVLFTQLTINLVRFKFYILKLTKEYVLVLGAYSMLVATLVFKRLKLFIINLEKAGSRFDAAALASPRIAFVLSEIFTRPVGYILGIAIMYYQGERVHAFVDWVISFFW